MAYRSFSLIPALSNHLLSDRFTQMDNLFSRLTGERPIADTPAYNLLKKDKAHYEMTVSVPCYTQDELDISVLNNQLTISGKPKVEETDANEEKDGIKWLHQGIRKSEFSLSFSLEHRITIQQASLDKGLLTLQFTYDIPEQEKPQKIAIGM
ncbi:Hsp20 family protein [Candidatus Fukatsuia symbiotica]|uniref:Heat-shock protein n=1 Tax=Candidatus Fukatsuia symbiotica TaxID=1878942 RepID=A0A2U8IAD0_9GAMM|nr:Hsp20 family protein [Candidatus Fukatsuia symbiotica]AWK15114.1 heat-shock protein [Candidatus Fukatsuia symbiotica]MEA9443929.1 Hsp20 family protein [Candidatus Fukatsuia symbiotica]